MRPFIIPDPATIAFHGMEQVVRTIYDRRS